MYDVIVRIHVHRLDLTCGMAPEAHRHILAFLMNISLNAVKSNRTVEHPEGDSDNKIGMSFCDEQANSCCKGFFNFSNSNRVYTTTKQMPETKVNTCMWLQVVITLHILTGTLIVLTA